MSEWKLAAAHAPSPEKLAANRANAQHSTGPRPQNEPTLTAAGARVSL